VIHGDGNIPDSDSLLSYEAVGERRPAFSAGRAVMVSTTVADTAASAAAVFMRFSWALATKPEVDFVTIANA